MKARGFCPGHITGFFEICDSYDNPEQIGSRGAGFSITLGATSDVELIADGQRNIEIYLNHHRSNAKVTRRAAELLMGDDDDSLRIETSLPLPGSQGYGMSAAGALGTSLAIAKIKKLPTSNALRAAHIAEVANRTGLGDAVAAFFGGFEIRAEPGIPPHGSILHFAGDNNPEILLCDLGGRLATKDVLKDCGMRRIISKKGSECVRALQKNPTLSHFMELSRSFAIETGLASTRVIDAMEACEPYGKGSMCMLGNSVFVIPKSDNPRIAEELEAEMARRGKVWWTRVAGGILP